MDEQTALDGDPAFGRMTSAKNDAVEMLAWLNRLSFGQDRSQSTDSLHEALATPRVIGRYRLISLVGMGSYGVVFRAEDPHTDRIVALKIAWPFIMGDPDASERFLQESQVVGRLKHDQIVQVFDAGTADLVHYIAFEFIDGPDLGVWLRSQNQIPVRQAVEIVRHVADAVHCAHREGTVHRDLKPSNILMRPAQNTTLPEPVVTDFGLARRAVVRDRSQFTATRAVVGTDRYMSPEQAAGSSREVTSASDVFSLGVILYELLSGARPFDGESSEQIRERIQKAEPISVRTLRRDCPAELEAVVRKAMDKSPEARYRHAGELVDDLQRFLNHEPVQARLPSAWHRAKQAVRRHPRLVVLALFSILAVGAGSEVLKVWQAEQQASEQRIARAEAEADAAKGREHQHHYAAAIRRAWRAEQSGDMSGKENALKEAFDRAQNHFPAGIEWRILSRQGGQADRQLSGHFKGTRVVRFSPTENMMISGGNDLRLTFWDTRTWKPLEKVFNKGGSVKCAEFSADGTLLAVGGDNGFLNVYRAADHHLIFSKKVLKGTIWTLAWQFQEKYLAVGGKDDIVAIVQPILGEVRTSEPLQPSEESRKLDPEHPSDVSSITYAPNLGQWVVLKGPPEILYLDPGTLNILQRRTSLTPGQHLGDCCHIPAGKGYLAFIAFSTIEFTTERDGQLVSAITLPKTIEKVTYTPSQDLLFVALDGGTIETLSFSAALRGELIRESPVRGLETQPLTIASSDRLGLLATGERGGSICIWQQPQRDDRLPDAPGMMRASPCGRWLAIAQFPEGLNQITLRDLESQAIRWTMPAKRLRRTWDSMLAFSPDGNEIAVLDVDGKVVIKRSEDGKCLDQINPSNSPVSRLSYSPQGHLIILESEESSIAIDRKTKQIAAEWTKSAQFLACAATERGEIWLEQLPSHVVLVRDGLRGPVQRSLGPFSAAIMRAALSRNGKHIALAGPQGSTFLVSTAGDEPPLLLDGDPGELSYLQFSGDGNTLLGHSAFDNRLRLWHVPTQTFHYSLGSSDDKILSCTLDGRDQRLNLGIWHADAYSLRTLLLIESEIKTNQ